MKRFPSQRCESAIQIVRPLESTAETQPQLQPALLSFSPAFLLVTERDRLKGEDAFARLVHRLNHLLETLRGGDRAESTILIYPNLHTSNRRITNAGDKRFRLCSLCADADRVRFVPSTLVAYI